MRYFEEPITNHNRTITVSVAHPTQTNMTGFMHFWGVHVVGFDDTKHCQYCLLGEHEQYFLQFVAHPQPVIGQTQQLPFVGNYLYICGVSTFKQSTDPNSEYMKSNFHLPVKFCEGGTVSKTTYNGFTISISNAEEIKISEEPAKSRYFHLGEPFWTCRNFQFGVQMFVK